MKNAIQNFNIPVVEFERAVQFYSTLLNYEIQTTDFNGIKLGFFACDHENGGVGGTLLSDPSATPSKMGTMVFLHAGEDLQQALDRMPDTGDVVVPKSPLGPNMGFFAIFDDSEGNRVGLFSTQ
ncbi:MAG: VOC family protein [Bacteroidota bacterium]